MLPLVLLVASLGEDPAAILELGAGVSKGPAAGPNLAAEVTPIERWLELEAGVTPLFQRHHGAQWTADFLFKKPWDLSKHLEFMAGLGPEWSRTARRNSVSLEAALDFMYWPREKKRVGFYLEPSYDGSVGVTFGLLLGIK